MRKTDQQSSALLRCRSLLVLLSQAGLILASLVCAWLLRFDFRLPDSGLLWAAAPMLIAVRLAAMPLFNLTHGWWRYTGISDAVDVWKAILAGSLAFFFRSSSVDFKVNDAWFAVAPGSGSYSRRGLASLL